MYIRGYEYLVMCVVCCLAPGQVVWRLAQDPMVSAFLPWGPGLGVLIRVSALLCVRAETLMLLMVQHMLESWSQFINTTIAHRKPSGVSQQYTQEFDVAHNVCSMQHDL